MWVLLVLMLVLSAGSDAKKKGVRKQVNHTGIWHLIDSIHMEEESTLEPLLKIAIGKMASKRTVSMNCAVVIADVVLKQNVRNLTMCDDTSDMCIPMYFLEVTKLSFSHNHLNLSLSEENLLRESDRMQCGGYILLLRDARLSVNMIKECEERRLLNPRARFLIWNAKKEWQLEEDPIWYRVPGVLFVRTNEQRPSIMEMRGIRWPPERFGVPTELLDSFSFKSLLKGKKSRKNDWFLDSTSDLRGRSLRVALFNQPPAVLRLNSAGDQETYVGVEIEILSAVASRMNFLVDYYEPADKEKWGGVAENGTTYGAVGELAQGRADIAIGSFFILPKYSRYMDMSVPYDVACITFLTPKPRSKPRWLAMILPLDGPTWGGAFIALVMPILIVPGLSRLAEYMFRRREDHMFRQLGIGCVNAAGLATQVALARWPRFWAVRLLVCWLWFFWLLLALAYRGGLVSFMALPLTYAPIETLRDLAHSSLELGGWGHELKSLLMDSATAGEGSVASSYQEVVDVDASVRRVAEGKFALLENSRFLQFASVTQYLHPSGESSMRPMSQCVVPVQIGIALQRHSPLTMHINGITRQLTEAGLVRKWYRDVVQIAKAQRHDAEENTDDGLAMSSDGSKRRAMSLHDLQGAIYLLMFGLVAASSFFAAEFINGNKMEARRKMEEVAATRRAIQAVVENEFQHGERRIRFPTAASWVMALAMWRKRATAKN